MRLVRKLPGRPGPPDPPPVLSADERRQEIEGEITRGGDRERSRGEKAEEREEAES